MFHALDNRRVFATGGPSVVWAYAGTTPRFDHLYAFSQWNQIQMVYCSPNRCMLEHSSVCCNTKTKYWIPGLETYWSIITSMRLSMKSRSVCMIFHHYLWPHVPQRTCRNYFLSKSGYWSIIHCKHRCFKRNKNDIGLSF